MILRRFFSQTFANMDLQKLLQETFFSAVTAVLPTNMIQDKINIKNDIMVVDGETFTLSKNVHVVGFGKAVLGMARAVEDILEEHIVSGILSVPVGVQEIFKNNNQLDLLLKPESKIEVFEGAKNNLPDENAELAAKKIQEVVTSLTEKDILLVLISGGGSALLPSPKPNITLKEKLDLTKLLSDEGATIQELNTVRKQLSVLKGGGLAKLAFPAKVISLILSDVIGNPLGFIASGPTVPNLEKPEAAIEILHRFNVVNKIPYSIEEVLKDNVGNRKKDIASYLAEFSHVVNILVGTNAIAVENACSYIEMYGFVTVVLTTELYGEARNRGSDFCEMALQLNRLLKTEEAPSWTTILSNFGSQALTAKPSKWEAAIEKCRSTKKPLCVLSGGETTVKVKGKGLGGRNQEMALSFLESFSRLSAESTAAESQILFLSAGTDGIDGPTDAAGAFVYPSLLSDAETQSLDPLKHLENNDSYNFFKNLNDGQNLLISGHTGTNVMDIQILLVVP